MEKVGASQVYSYVKLILWKNKIPTRRFVHKQMKDGAIN